MASPEIILVTGANAGIGKAIATELAWKGKTIILACRSEPKTRAAMEEIGATTGNRKLHFVPLDLASFASVRVCAAQIQKQFPQLHGLVNNAGLFTRRCESTVDGFEMQFGVHHLGHFLLTKLLYPLLKATATPAAPARVIALSSVIHRLGRLNADKWRPHTWYNPLAAYAQSKLCNVLFAREAARRWAQDNILVNAAHPGGIRSDIYREVPAPLMALINLTLVEPAEGAWPVVHLLTDPQGRTETGMYYEQRVRKEPSRAARKAADGLWLWNESLKLTGLAQ
jgi:NAD(P)-dependent dehydrogenase (short-subunit alcohol dehydrogenase family)